MRAVRFFLTTGPGTLDAEWRAWLGRHPGVMLGGQIFVATVAVLLVGLLAVLVVPPLVSLWLGAFVCLWGYTKQRDRQRREREREHRELLAALEKR